MDFNLGREFGDNSDAYERFAQQMREAQARYNGIVDSGNRARGINQSEYGRLISDPNYIQNKVASGFYESPYQKMMQDLVQQRMNFNATNTGMIGSGAANRAMQNELTNMTGQFENQFIDRGLNSYGIGLKGNEGLMQQGMEGMNQQNNFIDQAAAADFGGDLSKNQSSRNFWGTLAGGLGGAAVGAGLGFMGGGGWGGALKGGLGSLGNFIGQNKNASSSDVNQQNQVGGYPPYTRYPGGR